MKPFFYDFKQHSNFLEHFFSHVGSGAQPGSGGILQGLLPFLVMGIAFYFLIIAPGRKKQKDHQKMIDALEKGTKVKTVGGLFGTITGVKDDCFVIRISENVSVKCTIAVDDVSTKLGRIS